MRALLEVLLEENFDIVDKAKTSIPRHAQFTTTPGFIKVVIGMRRTGKTIFIYQAINALLNQGIPKEQILLINFEDERLLPMHAKEAGKLLDAFYQLYPENHHRKCYLFLDEIHNVIDWHLLVRRYYDKKNVELYLTGSSAKLLSKEIHTSLRGRSVTTEIWPYSFAEYLSLHPMKTTQKPFGQAAFDKTYQQLLRYLAIGGFPGVQALLENEWRIILQSYVETTVMRDIIERYSISNVALLKYMVNTLLKNSSCIFSVNKFYHDAKSQGYKISKDTIHQYLKYIEDTFLCFAVPLYSESERAQQNQPKKIYAIDHGLLQAMSFSVNALSGKLFENLVYIDLRRQHKKVYYYRTQDDFEIDFITVDAKGHREGIQVCWDADDPETLARENRALQSLKKELKIDGKVITPRDYLRTFYLPE